MKFWFNSLGAVGFSLVKNLEKEGRGEMGEIFFYLQETSLYEKLYFFHLFQSQTAPELMPGIPSSVLLSGSYCTWHLLWHMTVLQIIPGTFTLWKYHGEKASKGPLSACCQKPAGITPVSPALPARVQSPVDFRALQLQQCGRVLGGINAFFFWWKKAATLWISVSFAKWIHFRVKKHKLLEMDFTMKCVFVQRFPFALFFFLTWKTLKESNWNVFSGMEWNFFIRSGTI